MAKRFEEAAAADEILISDVTHRLVRDAVVAERVSDRVVKGGETLDGFAIAEVRRTRRAVRAASTRRSSTASRSSARCAASSRASSRPESVIS